MDTSKAWAGSELNPAWVKQGLAGDIQGLNEEASLMFWCESFKGNHLFAGEMVTLVLEEAEQL